MILIYIIYNIKLQNDIFMNTGPTIDRKFSWQNLEKDIDMNFVLARGTPLLTQNTCFN